MRLFSFCPQVNDVGETHSLVPGTVRVISSEYGLKLKVNFQYQNSVKIHYVLLEADGHDFQQNTPSL
jgi:hypothetical protein